MRILHVASIALAGALASACTVQVNETDGGPPGMTPGDGSAADGLAPPLDGAMVTQGGDGGSQGTPDSGAGTTTPDGGGIDGATACTRAPGTQPPAPVMGSSVVPGPLDLPQVVDLGGDKLTLPTFIPVMYSGDKLATDITGFLGSVGCTSYWHATTGEYGIGDAIMGTPVTLTEGAPVTIDDSAIASWLVQKIDGNDPQFPRPADGTVYVIFYPAATTITLQGAASCQDFAGYHESTQLGDGTPVVYAILPRCAAGSTPGLNQLQVLTSGASHEIIEAVTDPIPDTNPAYFAPDTNHLAFMVGGGAEVGDLCQFQSDSYFQPQGFPWVVQRIWSDSAARAPTNPCVPAATSDVFYVAPTLPDTVMLNLTGTPQTTPAVRIAVGSSATVPLTVFGQTPTSLIQVQAVDGAALGGMPAHLVLSLDANSARPGTTLHLKIQKQNADPSLGAEAFAIFAQIGNRQSVYWGLTSD